MEKSEFIKKYLINIKKKIKIETYTNSFKYSGELIYEDDIVYRIFDDKENRIIQLPKATTTIKILNCPIKNEQTKKEDLNGRDNNSE